MKKGIVGLLLVLLVALTLGGCARARAQGEFAGSTFGVTSHNADWIVISQSGGEIMDVWLIHDAIVTSAQESDGWIFTDGSGIPTAIGGDVKVLRVTDPGVFNQYHEYHMEIESQTYRELYN